MAKFNNIAVAILILTTGLASAFPLVKHEGRPPVTTRLLAKKTKGFSKNAEPKKSTETKDNDNIALRQNLNPSERRSSADYAAVFESAKVPGVVPPNSPLPGPQQPSPMSFEKNAGQRALTEMRRQRAEEKDAELRKVRDLFQADEQLSEAPAVIPERVAQRMGARMLPLVGLPLFGGMGVFVAFWYLATYKNVEFPPALVAGSTIGILFIGLLGITYSVMSASWDPDREGSFWGMEEFQRNVDNVKEGLGRSRENAVLRDKMAGLSPTEIKAAITDLEQREETEAKKRLQESLPNKWKDELE